MDKLDIWSKLSAPLPTGVISWRQDGKAVERDGRWIARFVAYIEANTVRERLDSIVPGEWDLNLELLPAQVNEDGEAQCSFKARLQILGVIREDVGTGRDYKAAATDAFKRVAVRFGIAHELYAYEQNWVQVESDSKYAKPVEDPGAAYARRLARSAGRAPTAIAASTPTATNGKAHAAAPAETPAAAAPSAPSAPSAPLASDGPACPKCGGRMYDNRLTKRNPKAPDHKCRNRACDGVIWPDKGDARQPDAVAVDGEPEYVHDDDDSIPF